MRVWCTAWVVRENILMECGMLSRIASVRVGTTLLAMGLLTASGGCWWPIDLPTQGPPPSSGPGAPLSEGPEVRMSRIGDGAEEVFIYEPAGIELASAPVIVFMHGYTGVNPVVYGAWLKHLVQRGNIVLYPVYQDSLGEPGEYTGHALVAIQSAFAFLNEGDHIRPDETKFAMAGHSLGGVLAMNLAAIAHLNGLPRVRAVLAANAGDTTSTDLPLPTVQTDNYEQIPTDMLFLGVIGADDERVGRAVVLALWDAIDHLPADNREVLKLRTDTHGVPHLVADHRAPLALDEDFDSGGPVALLPPGQALTDDELQREFSPADLCDYYGYWKWCDALTDAAFYGTHREYALGNTAAQKSLGTWSDGRPVRSAVRIRP